MENPYQPPNDSPGFFADTPVAIPDPGLIGQVRVFSILMIVHGVLATLTSVIYLAMAFVMPSIIRAAAENEMKNNRQDMPEQMELFMLAIYGGMGLMTLIGGILQIYGGSQTYGFRSRTLGMVASLGGLLTVGSCYCAPTAIGIAVYGMVVLMNRQVIEAFAMRQRGMLPDQIMASFYQLNPLPPRP